MVQQPAMQRRILQELHQVVGGLSPSAAAAAAAEGRAVAGLADPEALDYARINSLHYLRCFMHECLRLYTPSTAVAPRAASKASPPARQSDDASEHAQHSTCG